MCDFELGGTRDCPWQTLPDSITVAFDSTAPLPSVDATSATSQGIFGKKVILY